MPITTEAIVAKRHALEEAAICETVGRSRMPTDHLTPCSLAMSHLPGSSLDGKTTGRSGRPVAKISPFAFRISHGISATPI
jgi:hypothetical protein